MTAAELDRVIKHLGKRRTHYVVPDHGRYVPYWVDDRLVVVPKGFLWYVYYTEMGRKGERRFFLKKTKAIDYVALYIMKWWC